MLIPDLDPTTEGWPGFAPAAVAAGARAPFAFPLQAGALLNSAAGIGGTADYRPLDGLSDTRAEMYHATGMISVQLRVSLEASVRLRAHAFAADLPLGDIARDVVSPLLRFAPDPGPRR